VARARPELEEGPAHLHLAIGTRVTVSERSRPDPLEATQQTVRLFETLLRTSADGIVITDSRQNVVVANEAFATFFGRRQREVAETSLLVWLDQFGAAAAQRWAELEKRVRLEGACRDVDFQMTTGKAVRHLSVNASFLERPGDEKGGIIVSIWRDTTEGNRAELRLLRLNRLKEDLLGLGSLDEKVRRITEGVVEIFGADFARIWLKRPADLCDAGCFHATITEGPHVCRDRERCLHLVASSGRYTHTDGKTHRRVPLGCYKIGRVAAAEEPGFLTNKVTQDPRVHDHDWARELGLVSFAGYRLLSPDGEPIGVLALFSKHTISPEEAALLETLAATAAQVVQTAEAEDALRISEGRYRSLVENLPVKVFAKNADSVFVSCNESFAKELGIRPDQIAGKTDDDFYPNDLAEKYRADDRRIMDAGRTEELEERHVRGGQELFVRTIKTPLRDEADRVTGVLGAFWDITARKQAEESLRRSEERYRNVYDTAPLAFVLWDRQCRVTGWNDRAEETFGWSRQEVLGKNFFEFLIPESARPRVEDVVEHLLRGQVERDIVNENVTKRGEIILCRWNNSVFRDSAGDITGAVSLGLDITGQVRAEEERRQLEMRVRQAQKMESLGVLAGGVAHDFNNLLTGILGNAELALMDLSPVSPAWESIEGIQTAAMRAAELSRQMLAYSGKGKFVVEPIDLSEVVKEMTHLLRTSVPKKTVLQLDLAESLPAVKADATQIRQVVMNLITNAAEAIGEESGVISVTTGTMECDRSYLRSTYPVEDMSEGVYVYLQVSDTGCGMDGETQQRIFDPFFTSKFTGRGLGLAAVLGIIRGHRGGLKVYSESGRGTTFKILLPAANESARTTAGESVDAEPMQGSGTILLVDDENTVRSIGKRMLERAGFVVLTAVDGRQAVELFRGHADEIACVLLDLTMPHMDGEETFRALRQIRRDVPVVLTSGYNEQDVISRFAGKGLAGFIHKPFQNAALIAKLREAIGE